MDKSTTVLCVCTLVVCSSVGTVAMMNDVYPGLRRPPQAKISPGPSSNSYDENYLSQILNFIEEQARRKFQEKLKNYQTKPLNGDQEEGVWDSEIDQEQDFSFKMPAKDVIPSLDEPFEFGVAPNDPRFYENSPPDVPFQAHKPLPLENVEESGATSVDGAGKEAPNEGPYMRINGPLNVNPDSIYRSKEMQGLLHKWRQSSTGGLDTRLMQPTHDVVQQPIHLESSSINVYAVALIAGVSAAVTIGLIALGVGWYTFYKKSKAAQDVEYPAYGVTGPNKEKQLSPSSGDRRLAQNAQMYHYQHQKQQIIAMENKMNEDRNGSMSDVNSEDEEGDYTVYECPGLAPTGEMEVKNPLFFDDPTPATPANNNIGAASAKAQPKSVDQPPSAPPAEKDKSSQKK